jgi:hypothetical protein
MNLSASGTRQIVGSVARCRCVITIPVHAALGGERTLRIPRIGCAGRAAPQRRAGERPPPSAFSTTTSRFARVLPVTSTNRVPSGETSYIEDLRKRKGPDADQPHRIAYKKLVRA